MIMGNKCMQHKRIEFAINQSEIKQHWWAPGCGILKRMNRLKCYHRANLYTCTIHTHTHTTNNHHEFDWESLAHSRRNTKWFKWWPHNECKHKMLDHTLHTVLTLWSLSLSLYPSHLFIHSFTIAFRNEYSISHKYRCGTVFNSNCSMRFDIEAVDETCIKIEIKILPLLFLLEALPALLLL